MNHRVSYSTIKDTSWDIWQNSNETYNCDQVTLAVLMDIRGELQRLNDLLHCQNFQRIPHQLERIARNTTKKKKVKT